MGPMTEPTRITRDEVVHVAKLARLSLSDSEIDEFTGQLGDIEPTSHPLPMVNVLRPDVVQPALDRELLLSQAPASEDGQFRVPPILGEEP